MGLVNNKRYKYTWEEAIELLRSDLIHENLIFDSYLTSDLIGNSHRFAKSDEFSEVLKLIRRYVPNAQHILDMPAGNGIATYAFSLAGFNTTAVEPDPSNSVGRGAIEHVLSTSNLEANIIDAWGENLPFDNDAFDVVYIRQGLHHATNLKKMLSEISRVLKPNGVLIACREHVVDNYDDSLQSFLLSQVDHKLYGGENAFLLSDYRNAISKADFNLRLEFKPFDSIINLYPNSFENLHNKILTSVAGRILSYFIPKSLVVKIGTWKLNRKKSPGRLYSFVATKKKCDRMKNVLRKIVIKKVIKLVIFCVLKAYEVFLGKFLYAFSRKYASLHTRLMHQMEWRFSTSCPSHYKHEINLYNWIYDTSRVEFIERGGLPRMFIEQGDNVLDLCCGDGSNAYLFFSDISKNIDAIDYDNDAIRYAQKHYKKNNINYICEDLLTFTPPTSSYEVVVWSASVTYFSKIQRRVIFNIIYNSLKENGKAIVMTPLESSDSKAGDGQKEIHTYVVDKNAFENEFNDIFNIEFFKQTMHVNRVNLHYVLRKKIKHGT